MSRPPREARLIALVEHYFAAVDRMDLRATLECFVPHAHFTVATYDALYRGRDGEIRAMYQRLFARYASVWHGEFDHVAQPPQRIASRFRVENTGLDGQKFVKHNCNFFQLRGDLFEQVFVYMSGENSLG